MGRQIVVSSNCQTAGLAAALRAIFPQDCVLPVPFTRFAGTDGQALLVRELERTDVWVTIAEPGWLKAKGIAESYPRLRVLRVPTIVFSAFQPDICYVRNTATGTLTDPNYQSAIAIWAYKQQIDVADAEQLFGDATYRALGYFDAWDFSVSALKARFAASDLADDFTRFFLSIKRTGSFMHSLNHPKPAPLVMLAKLVAIALGARASVLDRAIDIIDGLNAIGWPVYPEIAEELSLPQEGYVWKMRTGFVEGVRAYLDYTYASLGKQVGDPRGLVMMERNEESYYAILAPRVRKVLAA